MNLFVEAKENEQRTRQGARTGRLKQFRSACSLHLAGQFLGVTSLAVI